MHRIKGSKSDFQTLQQAEVQNSRTFFMGNSFYALSLPRQCIAADVTKIGNLHVISDVR